MNSKQIFGLVLLLGGVIAIIAIVIWLINVAKQTTPTTNTKPIPITQPTIDTTTGQQVKDVRVIEADSPQAQAAQTQEGLKHQALAFAARFGTYSNTNSFASWRDLGADITANVQPFLSSQQQDLIKAHPVQNGYWGQTTKALSARLTSALDLATTSEAEVTVQAQQTITSNGTDAVSYQEIILTYKKVNGTWLVSHITTKPLAL